MSRKGGRSVAEDILMDLEDVARADCDTSRLILERLNEALITMVRVIATVQANGGGGSADATVDLLIPYLERMEDVMRRVEDSTKRIFGTLEALPFDEQAIAQARSEERIKTLEKTAERGDSRTWSIVMLIIGLVAGAVGASIFK